MHDSFLFPILQVLILMPSTMLLLVLLRKCREAIFALSILLGGILASCQTETFLLQPTLSGTLETALTRGLMTDFPTAFFDYSDARLDTVVMALQEVEAATPFAEIFEKEYGRPLWNMVYAMEYGGEKCFLVPLWKSGSEKKIESLWYFHLGGDYMRYFPMRRTDTCIADDEQRFMFDLFSYWVFGRYNSEEIFFVEAEEPQTRMIITTTECWDVYTGTEAYLEYQYTNCVDHTHWVEDYERIPLPSVGGGEGGSGNIYLPGVGGGGNIFGNSHPHADNLFKSSDISESVWEKVEDLLTKILEDCMGGNLYNALKSILKGNKITFQLTDDKDSSYSPNKRTLSLSKTDMMSGTLLHELFHVFQVSQESAESFNASSMNKEIEAHFAQYKYLEKNDRLKELENRIDRRWIVVKALGGYIDAHGKFIQSSNQEITKQLFEVQLEYNVVPAFQKVGYKNATFNRSLSNEKTFGNISQLTVDCD